MSSRRRITFTVALALAALLCASMLAPAFGAPKAVSAASLASKLASTLKIAKRADKNAKRAIAGLQSQGQQGGQGGQGGQGLPGPAGPKGDKGDPGTASNQGAQGPQGPAGPQGLTGDKGDKGDKGDACLVANDANCKGPKGDKGDACLVANDANCKGPKGDTGDRGPAGFSNKYIAEAVVTFPVATQSEPNAQARTVTCPGNVPTVTGGGYSFGEGFQGVAVVLENRPLLGGNAWLVRIRNNGNSQAITAGIYAICVS